MLTTIKGTYSNGQVTLLEPPPKQETTEVLVTFTKINPTGKVPKQPVFGYSKGALLFMAPDFYAPLDELKEYM